MSRNSLFVGAPSGAIRAWARAPISASNRSFHSPSASTSQSFHSPSASTCQSFHSPSASTSQSFHSPAARESLSLDWSRESNQREDHPALAPCAQSMCFGYASLLRGSLTAHPCAGSELAHIVWAILRTIPAQPRRQRGAPFGAHRARRSNSQSQSQSQSDAALMQRRGFEVSSHHIVRSRKLPWFQPSNAAGRGNKAPMSEARDGRVGAGPWTASCEGNIARLASDAGTPGGLLFAYFLLSTQEKVGRSPKASESFVDFAPTTRENISRSPLKRLLQEQGRLLDRSPLKGLLQEQGRLLDRSPLKGHLQEQGRLLDRSPLKGLLQEQGTGEQQAKLKVTMGGAYA